MNTSLTIRRRLSVAGLVLAVTAGLVLTTWIASGDSQAAAGSTSASASTGGDRGQLVKDLTAARALDGPARKDALAKIRTGAKSGAYGDTVQQRVATKADRRADRRAVVLALLPEQLQADLAAAKAADADERPAMMKKIRSDALDGAYGDQVKAAATLREQQRADRKK